MEEQMSCEKPGNVISPERTQRPGVEADSTTTTDQPACEPNGGSQTIGSGADDNRIRIGNFRLVHFLFHLSLLEAQSLFISALAWRLFHPSVVRPLQATQTRTAPSIYHYIAAVTAQLGRWLDESEDRCPDRWWTG